MINLLTLSLSLFTCLGGEMQISKEKPLMVILVFCFANSYLVGRLWMAIISSRVNIPQFSFNLIATVALTIIGSLNFFITGTDQFYMHYSIPVLLLLNFLSWLLFFDKFTRELGEIEGIHRFKLGRIVADKHN